MGSSFLVYIMQFDKHLYDNTVGMATNHKNLIKL